jgi:phosphonate transport system permease protein
MWQTIQMAVLATVMGFTGAVVLSFPAARNLMRYRPVLWITRRLLEVMRSIPQVVLAFILVWPFGIGPLAGILAIGIHSTGALGKLFSEVNENADMRPVEGMRAAGSNWVEAVRYGMVPQVLPGFLSYALLRFEINVRSSTIIGFVGAGGIGQELYSVISFNYYQEIGAIIVLIIASVSLIDLTSERLRTLAIGRAD